MASKKTDEDVIKEVKDVLFEEADNYSDAGAEIDREKGIIRNPTEKMAQQIYDFLFCELDNYTDTGIKYNADTGIVSFGTKSFSIKVNQTNIEFVDL